MGLPQLVALQVGGTLPNLGCPLVFFQVKKGRARWTQMTIEIGLQWEAVVAVDMTEI